MDIEWLSDFCLSLPGAKAEIKWVKDLCFTVAGKLFCVTGLEGDFQFSFKVQDELFEEACTRDGFVPAPYLARAKWVLVTKPAKLSRNDAETFIKVSHKLIFDKLPKKEKEKILKTVKSIKK